MWTYFVIDFLQSPTKVGVAFFFLLISFLLLYVSKTRIQVRTKIAMMHLHIFFFILPLIYAAFSWSCQKPIFGCVQKELFVIIVPLTLIATFFIGFIVIPLLYGLMHRSKYLHDMKINSFIKKESMKIGIKKPLVCFVENARPFAHSFTNLIPMILISVGLCEILTHKEKEAVLLHELYHIKSRTSLFKFSTTFLRLVSPVSQFTSFRSNLVEEEKEADIYAIKEQGTNKYILSAKQKIDRYDSYL